MDYTTTLSSLESSFTGVGGILVMAVAGVLVILAAHYRRMHSGSSKASSSYKAYRHTVIAPYSEENSGDPESAMSPHFSRPSS